MKVALLLALASSSIFAAGPVWDSSGNGQLNGTYNFRQVLYVSDGSGNFSRQIAYFGTIGFDGTGTYTLSAANTQLNTGNLTSIQPTGTYSVSASGFGFLSNPLIPGAQVQFLVSNHILIGSSTENGGAKGLFDNDLFVATPATPSLANANFNGAYTLSSFAPGRDVSFVLNPDGAGHLGTVTNSGYDVNGGTFSGSSANATYGVSGGVIVINNGGTFSAGGFIVSYEIENLYMCPDGNFLFGGSPDGYDIVVGVRNANGAGTLTAGLYNEIGLDEYGTELSEDRSSSIDTYYGAFNVFPGDGASVSDVIGHERVLTAGLSAQNYTYSVLPAPPAPGLSFSFLGPDVYTIGAGGVRIGFGIGPYLGIEVALPAPTIQIYQDPTIYLFPNGIVDTASSAPYTAGISPGEFITIYNGINLAAGSQCWTAGPPFPTNFGAVRVLIDNIEAPIYCAGSQITVIVPYEVSASPIASIQVIRAGSGSSNVVTTYVYPTTPGVFTVPAGGIGYAAAQHGDYSLITPANPAQPGETIVVYLSGLGSVLPVNGIAAVDGAAAAPNGDPIVGNIAVNVGGYNSTSIPYAGLTPGTAGLYQINFRVPASVPVGNDVLAIVGAGSYSAQALLPVGGGSPQSFHPAALIEGATPQRRAVLPRLRLGPQQPGEPFRSETQ